MVASLAAYKSVALLIGHVGRQAQWESLFEDIDLACSSGIIHAARECNGLWGQFTHGLSRRIGIRRTSVRIHSKRSSRENVKAGRRELYSRVVQNVGNLNLTRVFRARYLYE